jgi:hypothetical protein
LQAGADANSQKFTDNLISYLAAPAAVIPPTPAPASLLLVGLGALGIGLYEMRRRRQLRAA